MRIQVRSLASISGLKIWCCHELWCRSQMRLGSGVAVAGGWQLQSSDLTTSLGTFVYLIFSPKKQKKKKKKKKKELGCEDERSEVEKSRNLGRFLKVERGLLKGKKSSEEGHRNRRKGSQPKLSSRRIYLFIFNSYFPSTIFFLLYSMVTQLHIHVNILFLHIIVFYRK